MAVRLAMGASRARLVRQFLTESVLLGLLSGALGLFIGYAGLRLLFGMLPAAANFIAPKFDATVFVFALVVSLATGFLFGSHSRFQGFPRQRGGSAEGRSSHDREKPPESYAGQRSAGGPGGIFVSAARDGGLVPAKHRAGVQNGSRAFRPRISRCS